MSGALRRKLTKNSRAIAAQVHCYPSTRFHILRQGGIGMSAAMDSSQKYVLGLDLGSASLGWAMIALDDADKPTSLLHAGVRIFEPGVEGTSADIQEGKDQSKAVDRRTARLHRRQLHCLRRAPRDVPHHRTTRPAAAAPAARRDGP